MKLSRYNRIVDDVLLFNAMRGTLAVIEPDVSALLARGQFDRLGDDLLQDMVRGGFVVASEVDEAQAARHLWYRAQHDLSSMGVAISPTMDCNMNCGYCLARRDGSTMTGETADRVADFIGRFTAPARTVDLTWFGGEPLLALDVVQYISRQAKGTAERAGKLFRSGMFTNGYDLTDQVLSQLLELGVGQLVVAVDGPREVHERRRPAADGRPCFDRIIAHVVAAAERIPVILQCVVDKDNRDAAWQLFDDLAARSLLGENLQFRIGSVDCDSESGRKSAGRELSATEFDRLYIEALEKRKGHPNLILPFPSPSPGCSYQRFSTMCIGPGGELYKCIKTIGCEEWVIGTVDEAPDLISRGMSSWLGLDPFLRPACRECSILPICSGGCSLSYIKTGQSRCLRFRWTLDGWLRLNADWERRTGDAGSIPVQSTAV